MVIQNRNGVMQQCILNFIEPIMKIECRQHIKSPPFFCSINTTQQTTGGGKRVFVNLFHIGLKMKERKRRDSCTYHGKAKLNLLCI